MNHHSYSNDFPANTLYIGCTLYMYFGWIPYLEPSQQCVVDLQLSRYHVHHAITGAKKRAVNRFVGFDTNRASGHLTQSNICAESTLMGRCAFTSILL